MSTYYDTAINPKTGKVEPVLCIDDYFGNHRYGYRFGDEQHVYREGEVQFPKRDGDVEDAKDRTP